MKKKNPRDGRAQVNLEKVTVIRLPINSEIWDKFRGICVLQSTNAKERIEKLLSQYIEEWKKNNL